MNTKRFIYTLLAAVTCLAATAAGINPDEWRDTRWTDGFAFFAFTRAESGRLVFEGGTLHEGGYGFALVPAAGDNKWTLKSLDPQFEFSPFAGSSAIGSIVSRATIDGQEVLLVRNSAGAVTDVLRRMTGRDDLHTMVVADLRWNLAGEYTDTRGKQYTFYSDGTLTPPGRGNVAFKFEEIYDMPSYVITLATGEHWMFEPVAEGLDLYMAKPLEDDEWEKGQLIAHLTKKPMEGGEPYGCWPETSSFLLTSTYAGFYDKATLRLMRNEIYARHGVKFSSADLKARFTPAKGWPTPTIDATQAKLSAIELINVDLIRNMEAILARGDR